MLFPAMALSGSGARWRLADLIDFETLFARDAHAIDARDRRVFSHDIAPRLDEVAESRRRAMGLRLWLEVKRDNTDTQWPSQAWVSILALARWGIFLVMAMLGAVLVWGLCLGSAQRVHVTIFIGLTLIAPWLGFLIFALGRLAAWQQAHPPMLIRLVLTPMTRRLPDVAASWRAALADSRPARIAVTARAAALSQFGGLGYVCGALVAFGAALLLYDVRFYWEATLDSGVLIHAAVGGLSWPWAALWPAAVPDEALIAASRVTTGSLAGPVSGGAAWWRFLLASLVVWGVAPRLGLIAFYTWRERRALAGLDFQAPRHRSIWRALAGVSRGAVAPADTDRALVLDVGGHGIEGEAVRGYMLRRLRVAPGTTYRVSVLDDAAENAADEALADGPAHVVLLAADWLLSPRQVKRLQARVRSAVGPDVPVIWLVVSEQDGAPGAPGPDYMQHWETLIDDLRDPATEIAAYDPTA